MWSKILSILLSIVLVCLPFSVYAGEAEPDDSLINDGKVTVLSQGAKAPFTGILFDIPAATKLKLDKEFAQKEFELRLDLEKKYVVWVVSASEKDKFVPRVWSFPIVGSFNYLGWFSKKSAKTP